MESLDTFLRSVEARLRCTQERRAEVLEELTGHLEDRIAALMTEGCSRLSAERIALRELGAPRVLAFRLSRANGWSLAGFVLRQVWALGLAAALGLGVLLSLDAAGLRAGLRPAQLIGLMPFVVLGFALGGLVRELYWALALTNLAALFAGTDTGAAMIMLPVGLFFIAAMAGHWVRWPRFAELAWGSGALTVLTACLLPWSSRAYTARDLLFGRDASVGWMGLVAVWVPWLLARMLDAVDQRASRRWRGA